MAKLKLIASPTFKAKVEIPVPGSKPIDVEFTFKARTKAKFKEFMDGLKDHGEDIEDPDLVLDIACGWELEDAFERDNIETLTQNYIGAGRAIVNKYINELTQARLGN